MQWHACSCHFVQAETCTCVQVCSHVCVCVCACVCVCVRRVCGFDVVVFALIVVVVSFVLAASFQFVVA